MAIDPRISLAAQAPDVGQTFRTLLGNLQAQQNLTQQGKLNPIQEQAAQQGVDINALNIANAPLKQQQAEQNLAAGALNLQSGQAAFDQSQTPMALAGAAQTLQNQFDISSAQSLAPVLASGNAETITNQLNAQKQRAIEFQLPQSEIAEIDQAIQMAQTPQGIEQLSSLTNKFLTQARTGASAKAFAPVTDPTSGQLSTPVFDPTTQQTTLRPIEGAIGQTPQQKLDAEVAQRQKLSDIAVGEASGKATVARTSTMKKEFGERRRNAKRSERKVRQAQILAGKASQGLLGAGTVQLARVFPGIDASDEGGLSSAFKSLALIELQKFKGPTTDFEFAVTEDIAGSLGQNASANMARLASLSRNNWFNSRESQQFDRHIAAGHDPDKFSFNINEQITPKKGGPTFTLQDLQDTAVANHIGIDEVIARLSK